MHAHIVPAASKRSRALASRPAGSEQAGSSIGFIIKWFRQLDSPRRTSTGRQRHICGAPRVKDYINLGNSESGLQAPNAQWSGN